MTENSPYSLAVLILLQGVCRYFSLFVLFFILFQGPRACAVIAENAIWRCVVWKWSKVDLLLAKARGYQYIMNDKKKKSHCLILVWQGAGGLVGIRTPDSWVIRVGHWSCGNRDLPLTKWPGCMTNGRDSDWTINCHTGTSGDGPWRQHMQNDTDAVLKNISCVDTKETLFWLTLGVVDLWAALLGISVTY